MKFNLLWLLVSVIFILSMKSDEPKEITMAVSIASYGSIDENHWINK